MLIELESDNRASLRPLFDRYPSRPQFRGRGLARTVAAALVLYCLEHGLEPCWDAANEPSAAVARKLGFRSTGKYEAYKLKAQPGQAVERKT